MRNRRRPSDIIFALIKGLKELDPNKEYTINKISKKSGLHWSTVKEYLDVLTVFYFEDAPCIRINDKTRKVKILKQHNKGKLKKRIRKYIKKHPNCLTGDIIQAFENEISTWYILVLLDELKLEEKIL